jgi:HAD superfamily hydrolase (TIGR01509 family)
MKKQVSLVVFDCDGVLVDSEMLSAAVLTQAMAEIGFPISDEIFRSDFLGRSFASASQKIEARFGKAMPAGFQELYRARLMARMRGHLQAVPGVMEVLSAMRTPYCLATGSSPQRLAVSLSETGLQDYFNGSCFTASQVPNGKPAPDLFLHAAKAMAVEPAVCLVIEDSEMGVRAGLAAGMTVWQFIGGSHMKSDHALPDDVRPHRVIASMTELKRAFAEIGI